MDQQATFKKTALAPCLFVSLLLLVVACSEQPDKPDRVRKDDAPEGVKIYNVGPAGDHTEEDVDYEQSPPVGGEHNAVWQNSGFYEEPIRDENAVHTLEHGAVWIAYSPDLPTDQQDRIRELVEAQSCLLASPYPGLESPIVASAWGKQLELEDADSPDLERFIRAYRQGPQAPESGAPCTDGVGQPE